MKENQWDAIFIGAGITSLACAAMLVKQHPGLRILIVDKHIVPGGYATIFKRPKVECIFDCSLHKLSGMGEGGNLNRIFKQLGLYDELKLKYPTDYFCSYKSNTENVFANDALHMENQLCEMFPKEKAGINEFFRQVETFGRNGYYQFQMIEGTFEPDIKQLRYAHKHLKSITVEQALNEMFDDPYLIEILAVPGIYVGGYPEDLGYLYYLHVIYATLNKGNAYVTGASQQLSNVLAKRVESVGGKVLLSTPVNKILVDENNQALGIQAKNTVHYSNKIYINTSPHYAMENFFDNGIDLDQVKEKLSSLKPARSTTTVYAVTDLPPEELGLTHTESMIFSDDPGNSGNLRKSADLLSTDSDLSELAFWYNSPMEVTNYHLLDSEGGKVICLNVLDSIEHWPQRRSMPYREKKNRAAEVLIDRLIKQVPGLKGHIIYHEVSTPRTYVRFTNNTNGSGYGAMVSTDLGGHVFHHRFPIKGIDFVSAWVAGPSYEAAFGYAEMKAKKWSVL